MERNHVPVLGVLDQEHHEESDDRGAVVDNKLPTIGIVEYRPRRGSYNNRGAGQDKDGCARTNVTSTWRPQ